MTIKKNWQTAKAKTNGFECKTTSDFRFEKPNVSMIKRNKKAAANKTSGHLFEK